MCRLIFNFQPTDYKQKLFIYKDNILVKMFSLRAEEAAEKIQSLQNDYDVDEINLVGNYSYLEKIKNDIAPIKFNNKPTVINIIER